MTKPPEAGDVIRYAYLWHTEAERGQEEGLKDRPCVVVLAVQHIKNRAWITVAPITHAPPDNPSLALELPDAAKRRLGLDEERSWVILTELNQFGWPGPDVTPIPNRHPPTSVFGHLSDHLYQQIRLKVLNLGAVGRIRFVRRTE